MDLRSLNTIHQLQLRCDDQLQYKKISEIHRIYNRENKKRNKIKKYFMDWNLVFVNVPSNRCK